MGHARLAARGGAMRPRALGPGSCLPVGLAERWPPPPRLLPSTAWEGSSLPASPSPLPLPSSHPVATRPPPADVPRIATSPSPGEVGEPAGARDTAGSRTVRHWRGSAPPSRDGCEEEGGGSRSSEGGPTGGTV